MPLYFFDLHDGVDAPDHEGQELPGLFAAQAKALKEARQVIAASVKEQGKIDLRHNIKVRDESGATVYFIEFEEAVSVLRAGKPV